MKEQILELREQGKSYREIKKLLNCSLSTISFHCGEGQKEKNYIRHKKSIKSNVLKTKADRFKSRNLSEKSRSFQRRDGSKLIPREEYNFTVKDVLNKIGNSPKCYLSGEDIDISNPKSFHFDHIFPASKGGNNLLDNLGITSSIVNKMKHDLTIEEFLAKCKEILEYQGYEVRKRGE